MACPLNMDKLRELDMSYRCRGLGREPSHGVATPQVLDLGQSDIGRFGGMLAQQLKAMPEMQQMTTQCVIHNQGLQWQGQLGHGGAQAEPPALGRGGSFLDLATASTPTRRNRAAPCPR